MASPTSSVYLWDNLLRSVPRPYRHQNRVKKDGMDLCRQFHGLHPKQGTLTHNNGASSTLVYLDGTIPMHFGGRQYNIPVNIWVLEDYPVAPPMCYVTPTRDMTIKPRHRHVDSSGLVFLPYLNQWNAQTSNLVNLCGQMSVVFGQDTPVYSKQAAAAARPQRPPGGGTPFASQGYPAQAVSKPPPTYSQGQPFNPAVSRPLPAYSQGQPHPATSKPLPPAPPTYTQVQKEDPHTLKKNDTVNELTKRAAARHAKFAADMRIEIDRQAELQTTLKNHAASIASSATLLKEEKEQLEDMQQVLGQKEKEIDTWLTEYTGKEDVNPDDAFEAVDPLSNQLIRVTAEDQALEDVVYFLNKALQNGKVDLDTYTRDVRDTTREQFFKRALSVKIYDILKV
eukprot:TRINITY_DN1402_c0_g1_i1.p1 TRINITY_DN1402_c0_g1~~TRINITY_DN1402_c0_g1_i1.p1  ORF type:complete len:396 (+),score=62.35 TRINITY_DN1402_c0_g1_i1:125-1312(+)